jgi:ABC-type transporter Mla subunit MlaD
MAVGALVGAVLAACAGGLEFKVRFAAIDGLRTGDAVQADAVVIGEVTAVEYSDQGDYRVAVRIAPEDAASVTRGSIFFIDSDPRRPGRKALMVLAGPAGGEAIEDGAILDGTPKWAALMQRMTRRMEAGVAGLVAELDRYWQDIAALSASEQVARLEQELDRILRDLKGMPAAARKTLHAEILPRLREQLDALRRALETPEDEAQLERLEDKVEQIDRELRV